MRIVLTTKTGRQSFENVTFCCIENQGSLTIFTKSQKRDVPTRFSTRDCLEMTMEFKSNENLTANAPTPTP